MNARLMHRIPVAAAAAFLITSRVPAGAAPGDPPAPAAKAQPAAAAPATEWLLPPTGLAKENRLEVRFPTAMGADAEGHKTVPAETVLDVKPALPGSFRWLSARGGVFEPSDFPGPGASYKITLRKGLTDAAGKAVNPGAGVTASGPEFVVRAHTPRWFSSSSENARQPVVTLFFNDSVSRRALKDAAVFQDADGNRQAVNVEAVTPDQLGENPAPTGTWAQQNNPDAAPAAKPDAPVVSVARVSPAAPLEPGKNWTLRIEPGLKNENGKAALKAGYFVATGTVLPYAVAAAEAVPVLDDQQQLTVTFNKKMSALKPEEWARQVQVSPMPAGAVWAIEGQTATLTGPFTVGSSYEVRVAPGMVAADGTVLGAEWKGSVKFPAHEPHLSLPAFDSAQWIGGRGVFDFTTANLASVRMRVKKVPEETAVYLLNGYAVYEYDTEHPEATDHTRLAYTGVPGKTVWEKEIQSGKPLNTSERFALNWEEALGGKRVPGIYFVNVEATAKEETEHQGTLGAQAVIQLTDIGLAWKTAGQDCLIYAFSHTSGDPLPGVNLSVRGVENEPLNTVTTGPDGMATLRMDKAKWLLATKDGDIHAVELGDNMPGFNLWSFDLPVSDATEEKSREMMFFSERPVYQPGETVFFKAISRMRDGAALSLPIERKAKLEAFDPRNRVILTRDVEFSETGSLSDTVTLPTEGVGWYRLRLTFALPKKEKKEGEPAEEGEGEGDEESQGEEGGRSFRFEHFVLVQEYQPNSFRILFDDAKLALADETARVPLKAAYLMGKPLSGSKLTWTARLSQTPFTPAAYDGYRFCHAKSYYVWDGKEYHSLNGEENLEPVLTGQGDVNLSPKGEALIEAPVPAGFGVPGPHTLTVNAEITDLNQQTIAESWDHTEQSSDFYLGVKRPAAAIKVGESVPLSIVAVKPEGGREPAPVNAKVLVEHLTWSAARVQTAGGGTDVRNDLVFAKVGEESLTVSPEPGKEDAWTFKPLSAGTHNLTFTAQDSKGREVRTVVSIDVFGAGEMTWEQNDGARIDLVSDREVYRPGETARIVVKSPLNGTALVTVEREKVLQSIVRKVGPGGVIELPVQESWAPNVFISVMQMRGGAADTKEPRQPEYRIGYCPLKVESQVDVLSVELTPGSPEVRPGAMVSVKALVKDHKGAAVPNAELALWAVDEGILSLMPWELPDPKAVFHYETPLYVKAGISLRSLLPEDPEKLEFTNKGFVIGGGGEMASADGALRKNFKPTAYWHGSLETGADGTVEISFPAPDNLTEFRVMAVASEGVGRFGTGENKFKVNKPLMLEPSLPRFANVGDRITLKAVLHNTTDKAGDIAVEMTADERISPIDPESGKPAEGKTVTRSVRLEPKESRAVRFPVTFTGDGETVLRWKAAAAGEPLLADAVESKFNVGFAEPLLREIKFFSVSADDNGGNLIAGLNPALLEGGGNIKLTVSNSRVIEGAEAIEQLLHYPYGCAEQTSSSMMPWLTLRDLKKALPDINKPDAEIAEAIRRGCARLLSMQTAAGGLAYWPGGEEPTLWASAHGAIALTMASRAGGNVPEERLKSLTDWLSTSLRDAGADTDAWRMTERAYAAYALALAGKAEPGYHELLFERRASLTHGARALLALSIAEAGGPEQMVRDTLATPRGEGEQEWWWGRQTTSAMRVLTLLKIKDEGAGEELGRLLASRDPRGDWKNTLANSWVLMALSREAALTPPWEPGRPCVVTVGGKSQEISLPAEPAAKTITLSFKAGEAPPEMTATLPPGRRAFAKLEIATRQKPGEVPGRSAGFTISRRWNRVETDGTLTPAGSLRTGDLVLVTLDVTVPASAEYLAIDDPLPATLEGVNPNFTSMAAADKIQAAGPVWIYDHSEMRRDRMLYFRDYFSGKGKYELRYMARVIAEGSVTVPAAKIEMMYDPTRFGLSPSQKLVTEPSPDGEVVVK